METKEPLFKDWNNQIATLWQQGLSVAIGTFDTEGNLLMANPALCYYLDTTPETLQPKNRFINPLFSTLVETEISDGTGTETESRTGINAGTGSRSEGLIFEGLLTLGNYTDVSYVLHAHVFRRDSTILVYAELDAPSLIEENNKMSHLNQEVNNLQRTLIKEKKKLQETLRELRETQQQLIHSEKMNALGKLVAGVAHELNNPISFVYSNLYTMETDIAQVFASMDEIEAMVASTSGGQSALVEGIASLRKKKDLDFLREDLTDMAKESKIGIERIKTIVEDLRKFSRLDEAELKRVNLLDTIKSTLTILRPELSKGEIHFELSVPDIEVDCYPGQLNQAIMNVLINAIQAVEKGGNISLTVHELDEQIQLIIKDNGAGIPPDIKDRVFEPFFTTKPVGSGTGLGLSITYKIIHDLHKGSIDIHSEPGHGCTVVLSIPKTQQA